MTELLTLLILFAPPLLILWLANLADKQREVEEPQQIYAVMAWLVWGLFWLGLFGAGVLISLMGFMVGSGPLDPALADTYRNMGLNPDAVAGMFSSFGSLGMGMWLPSLLAVILVLPPVRRLAARLLPIDARSTVHAVALSFTMLVVANLWVTLAFGLDTLANLMEAGEPLQTGALVNITWAQEVMFALIGAVGVGWLARRGLSRTLDRLGIVLPRPGQVLLGVGVGLGMALLLIPLEYLMNLTGVGVDPDVNRLGEQVIGPLMNSVFGIVTLGLAAALGEETIFRGALQPRFGLFFTALLFALLHSTYGITVSTGIVFLIGLVLGWVRARHNTSTSMVVHATYNMTIGFLTFLSLWPEW